MLCSLTYAESPVRFTCSRTLGLSGYNRSGGYLPSGSCGMVCIRKILFEVQITSVGHHFSANCVVAPWRETSVAVKSCFFNCSAKPQPNEMRDILESKGVIRTAFFTTVVTQDHFDGATGNLAHYLATTFAVTAFGTRGVYCGGVTSLT